jgi:hypothetical protein
MSVSPNLPPQAYTREVLVKAFEWLNTQPASVRERAGTADALVALYLQAKRRGTTADGTPLQWEQPSQASRDAFKADLKNLAEGLRQFDAPPQAAGAALNENIQDSLFGFRESAGTSVPQGSAPPPKKESAHPPQAFAPPHYGFEPLERLAETVAEAMEKPVPGPDTGMGMAPGEQPAAAASPAGFLMLDPKSREWVREVQKRLNLTSESDAIRALIAIGYERLRDLLPRS